MDCTTDSTAMSPDMREEGTFEKFFVANISQKHLLSILSECIDDSPLLLPAQLICCVTHLSLQRVQKPRYFQDTQRLFHSEVQFQTLCPSTYYLHRIPCVSDVLPIVLGHSASCHLCLPAPRVDWDPIFIFYSLNKWCLRMCLEPEAVARRRARVFLKQEPSRRSLLSDTAALNLPRGQALPESSWVLTGDGVGIFSSKFPAQSATVLFRKCRSKEAKQTERTPPPSTETQDRLYTEIWLGGELRAV